MTQHIRTTSLDLLGDWRVECSCGWESSGHETKLLAMGAGDWHLAMASDRAAWRDA